MYLLDTNHCSRLILQDPELILRLSETPSDDIATCAIVAGELINMGAQSQQRFQNLIVIKNFLDSIYIYPVNTETASVYGELKAAVFDKFAPKDKNKRRKFTVQNIGFGENDLWIAAIAIQHNLTIITADRDFQRIQEVHPISLNSWLIRD
jgi:tRNA(fMet)-specific endonuclease VapC